jgi:hypothetical protein
MAYLNIPIPPIECYVRGNFLRNQEDSFDKKFECYIFGMSSIPNKTPLFHFMMSDGGLWWRMPLHAFCWKEDAQEQELDELVLWDSYSYYVSITQFPMLKNSPVQFVSRRKNKYKGRIIFTLDWGQEDRTIPYVGFSEHPSQHKCGHFIMMDNGNYAIQPNNRLLVFDSTFYTNRKPLIERKYNSQEWSSEGNPKWMTPDSDNISFDFINTETNEDNI